MNSRADAADRLLGKAATVVRVEMLFYRDEVKGVPVSVSIDLEDGLGFLFGCAGDGGIFIRPCREVTFGAPPDTTSIQKEISGLVGPVRRVDSNGNCLRLTIGMRELQIVNDDDELLIIP